MMAGEDDGRVRDDDGGGGDAHAPLSPPTTSPADELVVAAEHLQSIRRRIRRGALCAGLSVFAPMSERKFTSRQRHRRRSTDVYVSHHAGLFTSTCYAMMS